ncbi:MAG TPA: nucleotidyltransferase domain-containing protein [Bacillota bacterium]|nr:nucleotidyltransferase domain-containing protein [Bacillota bacterium]
MNNFGISEKSYKLLMETFVKYPQVEEVIIFGSRAKGNYKKGSDIDLAIKGAQSSAKLALTLQSYINEELPIPYMVDVIDYNSLNHRELKEHIDRVGIKFYKI